jgi:hypothetical protein
MRRRAPSSLLFLIRHLRANRVCRGELYGRPDGPLERSAQENSLEVKTSGEVPRTLEDKRLRRLLDASRHCSTIVLHRLRRLFQERQRRLFRARSMTYLRDSGTSERMGNFDVSGHRWSVVVAMTLAFGAMNCEKSPEAEQKPTPSAVVAAPLEVPTAQPPKLADQPVLAPPSLAPLPGSEAVAAGSSSASAKAAPAPAATTAAVENPTVPVAKTADPKPTPTTPGARPTTTSPGPMAPRSAPTM